MKRHSTDDLIHMIEELPSAEYLTDYAQETIRDGSTSFCEFLNEKREQAGITAGELIRRANLQRTYGYQILSGVKRPGRDKVIALALALGFSLDETQRALKIAQEGALYPRTHRDSVLIFSIQKQLTVSETNALLYEQKELPLN